MVTIKDIAEKLGLSTTTVSNVIHGKTSEVSPKTVAKVRQMLAESDYVPNINARNLAQNQSRIIGVAMKSMRDKYTNMISDPFTGELIGAIEKEVRRNGYFLMLYISDDIYEIIQYISSWNADGLILLGLTDDDYLKLKQKYRKPLVLIDSYANQEITKYVNIGLEDEIGGYHLTNWLIENGHHKLAFVSDNMIGVDYMRYRGFRRSLTEHQIPCTEENLIIIRPNSNELDGSLKEIYNLSGNYTALVCASDYYAILIMNYLQDQGMRIPADISITGFDNNLLSQVCRPTLTTVAQNVEQKGEESVLALLSMIQNPDTEIQSIRLPTTLIIRNSVRNIS